jgi:hypothetical protein
VQGEVSYTYYTDSRVTQISYGAGTAYNADLMTVLAIDEYFSRTDSSGNVSSFLADALGSTVGLAGAGGSIATNYTYEPFGNATASGAASGNPFQFTR